VDAAPRILEIRGQRVLLDSDLAALYGVTTRRLNEQVRRNADRYPADFLLELTIQEVAGSRSQIATLNKGSGVREAQAGPCDQFRISPIEVPCFFYPWQ
jgi:hypothetical protein